MILRGDRRFMLLPTVFAGWALFLPLAQAGLEGGVIVSGQGTIVNSHFVVQDSARMAINAAAFGLKLGETFTLQQNFATDMALIRVLGQDPSNIFGSINAKGQLFISNPNGVLFGAGAQVNVGGLVATSLGLGVSDFMAGRYAFSSLGGAGSVVNLGNLTAAQGGYIALLAPEVRNEGVVSASLGTALMAAGDKVTLAFDNRSLLGYTIDKGALDALAENRQLILADGGQVLMGAKAADTIAAAAVNNTGVIRARSVRNHDGVIRLSGDASITSTGTLDVSSRNGRGGEIDVNGRFVALGGAVNASGRTGGNVSIHASGDMSLADRVIAKGAAGKGGSVRYEAGGEIVASSTSYTDVSGAAGGLISVNGGAGVLSSGAYRAVGRHGAGGLIDISGGHLALFSAQLNASGLAQGGLVRVGGAFQGGKSGEQSVAYDQFVARWGVLPLITSADTVLVNDSTHIDVSSAFGEGGTAVVWSNGETTFLGHVNAGGLSGGGAVEVSAADTLRYVSLANIRGAETLLLDPKNIIIGDTSSVASWLYSAVLGAAYSGGNNLGVASLAEDDGLGVSVAMSANGRLMAVGAHGDDGAGNTAVDSGAVRLFSFADGNFGGAALQATVGKGYTGGNNINVATLQAGDYFGSALALNAAGNMLAIGATGDDGSGNTMVNSGAVYMFRFLGSDFSGGYLQGIAGKGYVGGSSVNVATLEAGDGFGSAVALNALGNRMAVGAYSDDGAGNVASGSGAVYLYSFADNNFGGAALESIMGKGYSGGKNVDIAALEAADGFGISASLNAAGDRLVVGAFGDDGAGNLYTNSGAAYLFTFADGSFSGGNLHGLAGKGYGGANDMNVANLESGDGFGRSVALNAAADRLAVGAYLDDGAGNLAGSSGAVYMFGFADGSFAAPSLQAIIGKGYSAAGNIDLSVLDAGDYFGTSLALNGAGDRMAVGAMLDDGAGNAAIDAGAVHLFSLTTGLLPSAISFADYPGQTVTIQNTQLESVLSAGTNVLLQANNDITFSSAVAVNNTSGDGGSLSLHAGRSISFNADVSTDNGNLIAVAGDPAAIASERDAGVATITIGNGVTLDTGSGIAVLAAVGGNFVNNSGSSTPVTASRWHIYSTDSASNTLGGMTPTGKHYNQPYIAGSAPAYASSGNWLFYSIAPVLSVTPSSQVISDGRPPAPFSATYSGFIDGDTVETSGISGVPNFAGGGAAPGTYNIDYVNGLLSSLGYTFANNATSVGELVVMAQALNDAISDAQRPPETAPEKRSLPTGCGAAPLITSSSGAVFERFLELEEESCEPDPSSDGAADDDKKRKCLPASREKTPEKNTDKL